MKRTLLTIFSVFIISILTLGSCGPVVFSSRLGTPPPPWYYPNRVETVRYIYFPDYEMYYDFSFRTYRYFDNGVWISVKVLPKHFHGINLKRSRKVRIHNYFKDDLKKYHQENKVKRRKNTSRRFH